MGANAGPGLRRPWAGRRDVPTAHQVRAARLWRRRQRRKDAAFAAVVLCAFCVLVALPQYATAGWTSGSSATSMFTAAIVPQPPADVTATIDCQPGSTSLVASWTPSGWEDGFTVEIYKAVGKDRKLIETYDIPAPAVGFSLDLTGWDSGRYVVVVSGYDDTQTLTGVEATFQKIGSCA